MNCNKMCFDKNDDWFGFSDCDNCPSSRNGMAKKSYTKEEFKNIFQHVKNIYPVWELARDNEKIPYYVIYASSSRELSKNEYNWARKILGTENYCYQ